jgi:hypothetical protein
LHQPARTRFAGAGASGARSESERRHAEDDYFREAPEREQLNRRAAMHPLMLTINGELSAFAHDGVLATQGVATGDSMEPHLLAEALRQRT